MEHQTEESFIGRISIYLTTGFWSGKQNYSCAAIKQFLKGAIKDVFVIKLKLQTN